MTPTLENYQSAFLKESVARGFVYQGIDLSQLDQQLHNEIVVGYIGFDATASSLHVGNLVQIMRLRLLQKTGHKPIVLMGDGTTRIGDPSGKDTQRQMLSSQQIEQNLISIQKIFTKYLRFDDSPTGAVLVRNSTWLQSLNYLDFLRNYGQYFSMNRMLGFDSVKSRLDRDQPLSFLEFNYMILQGYDFLHLYQNYNCILQLGGSDQWGNIINGVELIRRVERHPAFGVTVSLITTADGKKMGKTAQGAVWLNADMLSAFDYWQFWRNTHDADVGRFLRIFTDLPLAQITELERLQGQDINQAKIILADAVTTLCHGEEAVETAHTSVTQLFNKSESTHDIMQLPVHLSLNKDNFFNLNLVDLLEMLKLSTSKSQARRLIRDKSVRLNDQLITDELCGLQSVDVMCENRVKVSVGKKRHLVVEII